MCYFVISLIRNTEGLAVSVALSALSVSYMSEMVHMICLMETVLRYCAAYIHPGETTHSGH